jgi:Ricin-type beta-trefoil lectin domain-like
MKGMNIMAITRRTGRAHEVTCGGMVRTRAAARWRPALWVAVAVALLAPLLQAGAARAANGLPTNFYANVYNPSTNTCVNVRNDSTQTYAWIQEYGCDGTGASDFYFATVGSDGVYEIIGEHSNLCMMPIGVIDFPGNSSAVDATQYYCTGQANELWKLLPVGGGHYELYNLAEGTCLTEPNGNWWTILQLTTCQAAPSQDFYLANILAA